MTVLAGSIGHTFGVMVQKVQRVVLYAAAWGSENLYNRPAGEEMHSPFGGWRHHLSPASGGTITRAYCRAAYEERSRGVLFCPLHRGKSGEAG